MQYSETVACKNAFAPYGWILDQPLKKIIALDNIDSEEKLIDCILNGRNEKSIKKALCQNIELEKNSRCGYSYAVDFAILRVFEDTVSFP